MKLLPCFFTVATIFTAALPADAQVNPSLYPADVHALHYGKKCILKKGAIIAANHKALVRFCELAAQHDSKEGIRKMVQNSLVDCLIVDALVIPVAPSDLNRRVVEVHIPGYLKNVFTLRAFLDGDVKGYLAEH